MKYPTIHIEGAILSADILDRIYQSDMRGQKPADFGLDGAVKDEIARAFADAQDTWRIYQRRLERLNKTDRGTTETRNHWIVPLLGLLGYKLEFHQRGDVVDGRTYAISHRDRTRGGFPVHIMGYRDSLDRKREDSGPRMSPHALVQEYLNLTEHLYAIVTNGRQLRLLRDSTRLVKLSYIEFDLEQMIEEGHFADFAILFRILHATRMPVSADDSAESLIEQYHQDALDSGSRIRDGLSNAVEDSIKALANGFLRHPDNEALREAIRDKQLDARTYYQYQLRLIYRLLFLMVIEERNLVYPDGADRTRRDIYDRYYSVSNLRRLATRPHLADSRHKDYWMALKNTFRLFEQEKYGAPLGIKPLAGDLFSADAVGHLNLCSLDNSVLIACLSNLSVFEHPETHQRIRVNYAALNVEEFGSVYEGLLEYDARIAPSNGAFVFSLVRGDERAASGSHYTPDELVTPLIRNSLDHVIKRKLEEAEREQQPRNARNDTKTKMGDPLSCPFVPFVVEKKERALLSIKVCDVACGSGHILLNAARRIATELAIVRTGEEQPSPKALREAVRDVIRHCIYGVDLNPMAVELCKVALWLESHNPNAPLGFLDHHIKCGNAIVGLAHANELERGIPDEAFKRLPDDDKDVCARLRKNNKAQRKDREQGQQINYGERVGRDLRKVLDTLAEVDALPERTPDEVAAKQDAYDKWKTSIDRRNLKIVADLQVAQFFIPKTPDMESRIVTDETYFRHLKGELQLAGTAVAEAMAAANKRDNKFFHWFLEFPEVFVTGGFDCILGNPPYLGGQALSGTYGHPFCEWVRYEYAPTGLSDLVVFFLRRNYALIGSGRFVAILTTNSIKDGDVRKDGLEVILNQGGSICFAIGSVKWPGRANLFVSLLAVHHGAWTGARNLNGKPVECISAFLEDYEEQGDPFSLVANSERVFQGAIFSGDGFLLSHDRAQRMVSEEPVLEEVIHGVINGRELNSDPSQLPGRRIIHFRDWPESRAREYHLAFEHLRQHVKPWRDQNARLAGLPWWQFERPRLQEYDRLRETKRCFVTAATTKYLSISACQTDWVFLNTIYVFCSDSFAEYSVLQSALHEAWARKYSGCLKRDLRYSPTDCFENFPFPAEGALEKLVGIGEAYHEERKALMLQLQLGLTKTYNLFHTRDLTPEQVAKAGKAPELDADAAHAAILALRQRHVEMDNAVLAAYGWDSEVDLAHDFYEVDYLPENDNVRFTISPDARRDMLQRLLKLNHERHAQEVAAGLHEKKAKRPKKPDTTTRNQQDAGQGQLPLDDAAQAPGRTARGVGLGKKAAEKTGVAEGGGGIPSGPLYAFSYGPSRNDDEVTLSFDAVPVGQVRRFQTGNQNLFRHLSHLHTYYIEARLHTSDLSQAFPQQPVPEEGSWWRLEFTETGTLPVRAYVADTDTDLGGARVLLSALSDDEMEDVLSKITLPPSSSPGDIEAVLSRSDGGLGTFVATYNVGQGLCCAVCDRVKAMPLLYFDFGCGCYWNHYSRPSEMRFCFTRKPAVVLSHWHPDHYMAARLLDANALEQTWVVPLQKIGPTPAMFAARLMIQGRIMVWPDGLTAVNGPLGQIARCTGNTLNTSGLAMIVKSRPSSKQSGGPTTVLLPGDSGYRDIPGASSMKLDGLVVSHHGGIATGSIPSPLNGKAVAALSFGDPNEYGHPLSQTVSDLDAAGWAKRLESSAGHIGLGLGSAIPIIACGESSCDLQIAQA